MTEVKKIPLILFSGGLDSTYLLQQELEKGPVEVLYVEGRQSPIKVLAEKRARAKIIRALENITGNDVVGDHCVKMIPEVQMSGYGVGSRDFDWKFEQPYQWLMGAIHIADGRRHSALMIAYVAGDQISSDLPKVKEAWNAMVSFSKCTEIPLEFPTVYVQKRDIINRIKASAYRHHWVCELPTVIHDEEKLSKSRHLRGKEQYEACGQCAACLTKKATVSIYEEMIGSLEERMRRRLRFEVREDRARRKKKRIELEMDSCWLDWENEKYMKRIKNHEQS